MKIRNTLILAVLSLMVLRVAAQEPVELVMDPQKVRGAEACGECHLSAFEVWKKTPHARGFKTLHRLKASEEITRKMGFPLIKRESLCLNCHYTPTIKRDTHRALSGVSCESCHGAGADWIDVHNDYGGKGIDHKTETAEHKQQRIAAAKAGGMLRPSELYGVVANCYSCHTVPHERLINVGGHTSGSTDFEFLAWQEKIRHNFLDSFLNGDGTQNVERPPERKRVMYLLGRCLELEYSLRGMGKATEPKRFAKAMSRRVRNAVGEIRDIAGRVDADELDKMLAAVRDTRVIPNNGKALETTAESIGVLTRQLLARADKLDLAIIDKIIDGTAPPLPEPDLIATTTTAPDTATPTVRTPDTPDAATDATPKTADAKPKIIKRGGIAASGQVKTRIRPVAKHDSVGPSKCGNCHEGPTEWWYSDPHFASMDRFFENDAKARQIADFYGLSPGLWLKGNRICADCHATVLPHRKTRDARDGVGCESCHGGAADYLEPHKEGDKALGLERPGYKRGLELGMAELRNSAVRAEACASCHYITDERLLSSGHPSGEQFDYAASLKKIRHWEGDRDPDAGAYAAVLSKRGPVPQVTLARKAETIIIEPEPQVAAKADPAPKPIAKPKETEKRVQPKRPQRPKAVTTRPARSAPTAETVKLRLEPFPDLDPNAPIEDVLLFIKQRIQKLYEAGSREKGNNRDR
ncbi:MAG: multiheme c-type cytochrome [Acidobacteriota bacterium]|nr:multiheme c-type cytochrome [Acidobacteriota bacterium]